MTDDEGRKSALRLTFSGVQFDTKPSDHYVDGDWRSIQFAPIWILEAIAGADKKVDEKERAAFQATLTAASESLLTQFVFAQFLEMQSSLETERSRDKRDAWRGLAEVEALLGRYPNVEQANVFRKTLVGLAEKIASASGGGLFGFGSKVSDAEADAIRRLQLLFRVQA